MPMELPGISPRVFGTVVFISGSGFTVKSNYPLFSLWSKFSVRHNISLRSFRLKCYFYQRTNKNEKISHGEKVFGAVACFGLRRFHAYRRIFIKHWEQSIYRSGRSDIIHNNRGLLRAPRIPMDEPRENPLAYMNSENEVE
jgi:hypothetical protein